MVARIGTAWAHSAAGASHAGLAGGQGGDACVQSGQAVLGDCQEALAQLFPVYPPSSTEPATDVQIDNGYVALKIGQQPTDA